MKNLFWSLLPVSLLFACSSNEDGPDALLAQPPFQTLTDSIRQFPKNSELYYRRGVLLYQNNQPSYAAQDLRQAWNLQPKEEYALSMTTLLREKSADSAIVFIESALKKLPNSIALRVDWPVATKKRTKALKPWQSWTRSLANTPTSWMPSC